MSKIYTIYWFFRQVNCSEYCTYRNIVHFLYKGFPFTRAFQEKRSCHDIDILFECAILIYTKKGRTFQLLIFACAERVWLPWNSSIWGAPDFVTFNMVQEQPQDIIPIKVKKSIAAPCWPGTAQGTRYRPLNRIKPSYFGCIKRQFTME